MPSHPDRVRREHHHNYEWAFCPTCGVKRRFEYKVHLDDFAGECGHRLTSREFTNLKVYESPALIRRVEDQLLDEALIETKARDPQTGVSIRFVKQYDVVRDDGSFETMFLPRCRSVDGLLNANCELERGHLGMHKRNNHFWL